MLNHALKYLKLGYSVIPCKRDKKALISWADFQNQHPTQDQVKTWFEKYKYANIAIITGEVSGVDVIDCDTEDAFQQFNENFLSETVITPITKTPKGYHIYFKHRPGLSNAVRALEGTDLRTSGGYVIAPPSKNSNGNSYTWYNGLSIENTNIAEMPGFVFDILEQASRASKNLNKNAYNSLVITATTVPNGFKGSPQSPQSPQVSTNYFTEGRRDNDIFHAANCLIKGGCEKDFAYNLLELLAKNCSPPFPEKELKSKIESALNRETARNKNIMADVRDYIMSTNGHILSTNVHKCLQLSTRKEMKAVSMALKRLCDEKLIEKTDRSGEFRIIDQDCQPVDWMNSDENYIPVWLPLGLGDICGVLPGNVLVFAGAKDSGKTAFLLNIAKENRYKYKVHYFNSEMGSSEFKMRVNKFTDVSISQWDTVSVYERDYNFHDVIKIGEGILNIIDFLEAPDEVWKIGGWIKKIHSKLDGALAVIAIQKKIGQDLGRGAEFSMEKARLYVSLDYGKAKIISCKNFRPESPIGNPRGYQCNFKLIDGCRIKKDTPWIHQTKEKKEE